MTPPVNGADTPWVVATVLVMLMTLGLGVFGGGLVRQKNARSTAAEVQGDALASLAFSEIYP